MYVCIIIFLPKLLHHAWTVKTRRFAGVPIWPHAVQNWAATDFICNQWSQSTYSCLASRKCSFTISTNRKSKNSLPLPSKLWRNVYLLGKRNWCISANGSSSRPKASIGCGVTRARLRMSSLAERRTLAHVVTFRFFYIIFMQHIFFYMYFMAGRERWRIVYASLWLFLSVGWRAVARS